MITLNGVSYASGWRHRRALNDVSLSLPDAGVVALVGPEGGGKTTLMQILAGLTAPSSGTVSMDGRALPAREALERAIMVSPSHYFGELFGISLVKYAQLRPTWDQGIFERCLERFETGSFLPQWKAASVLPSSDRHSLGLDRARIGRTCHAPRRDSGSPRRGGARRFLRGNPCPGSGGCGR